MCTTTNTKTPTPTTTTTSPITKTPRHEEPSYNAEDDLSLPDLHLSDLLDDDDDDTILNQEKCNEEKVNKAISIEFIWTKTLGFIGLLELLFCLLTYTGHTSGLLICQLGIVRLMFTACILIQALKDAAKKAYSSSALQEKKKDKKNRRQNPTVTVRGRLKHTSKKKSVGSYMIMVFLFNLFSRLIILPTFCGDGSVYGATNKIGTFLLWGNYQKRIFSLLQDSKTIHNLQSYSLIDFFILRTISLIRGTVSEHIHAFTKMIIIRISKHAMTEAMKHPFLIHFHIQQLFSFIRWAKFLVPLLGACNKLKSNIVDGVSKFKQRQRKRRIEKSWNTVLQSMKKKNQLDRSIRQIQYEFRRRKEEKALRRLRYMQLTSSVKPRRAVDVFSKIENKLKEQVKTARSGRAMAEKIEVNRLEKSVVTIFDKQQIESHEMKVNARKCFLIQPNTTFSVAWKFIAVSCITLELLNNIFRPYLKDNMEQYTISELLKTILFPQSSSRKCANNTVSVPGAIFSYFKNSSEIKSRCIPPLSTIQIFARVLVHHLVPALSLVIGTVRFFDVFLTFFTGEFTPNGGVLLPKPFFRRWIIPGICLQFIVNPSLYWIYPLLEALLDFTNAIGAFKLAHLMFTISYLSPKFS